MNNEDKKEISIIETYKKNYNESKIYWNYGANKVKPKIKNIQTNKEKNVYKIRDNKENHENKPLNSIDINKENKENKKEIKNTKNYELMKKYIDINKTKEKLNKVIKKNKEYIKNIYKKDN